MAFKLPPSDQQSSTLLQMPVEIRLKILRFLVVKGSPIESWKTFQNHYFFDHDYFQQKSLWLSLSSQILQCCQVIFHEAEHLLYNENTLEVQLAHRAEFQSSNTFCYFLDYYIDVPDNPLSEEGIELREMLTNITPQAPAWGHPINGETRPSAEDVSRTLFRIQNILIDYDYEVTSSSIELFTTILALRECMQGKDVTVQIHSTDPTSLEWYWRLKCFEMWRCESIVFLDNEADLKPLSDKPTIATIDVIEGDTPIVNLLPDAIELHRVLSQIPNYGDGDGLLNSSAWHSEIDDFWDAIIEQDARMFALCKKAAVSRTLSLLETEEAREAKVIERCREIAQRDVLQGLIEANRDMEKRFSEVRSQLVRLSERDS